MTHQFSGLIKCLNCGKNFKTKMERKKPVYICSTYSNYGKERCPRYQLSEEELIYSVEKHLWRVGKQVAQGEGIAHHVKRIDVNGQQNTIIIYYHNDDTFTYLSPNKISY